MVNRCLHRCNLHRRPRLPRLLAVILFRHPKRVPRDVGVVRGEGERDDLEGGRRGLVEGE